MCCRGWVQLHWAPSQGVVLLSQYGTRNDGLCEKKKLKGKNLLADNYKLLQSELYNRSPIFLSFVFVVIRPCNPCRCVSLYHLEHLIQTGNDALDCEKTNSCIQKWNVWQLPITLQQPYIALYPPVHKDWCLLLSSACYFSTSMYGFSQHSTYHYCHNNYTCCKWQPKTSASPDQRQQTQRNPALGDTHKNNT